MYLVYLKLIMQTILFLAFAGLAFLLIKRLTVSKADFKSLVTNGALIIDVRTPQEFDSGHITNAVNIPLHQIADKASMLAQKNQPIITCCASGMRSGQATSMLKQKGIEVYNGGGWQSLNRKLG
jgi:phage shock protein E